MELIPALFRITNYELFDLLKLMDSKNTPGIFSMSTGFFSKACRETSESLREVSILKRLIVIVPRDWLFRSGYKIEVILIIFVFRASAADLV
jgi:hypothetical protein